MFPFSSNSPDSQPAGEASPAPGAAGSHPLDGLTGGVFSAATSGERAQRVRDWLATNPTPEQMQEVFKELSAKDRGAARALRERLDELRRAREQEGVLAQWQARVEALLAATRLNIADALAWQRDAAKAGAPLAREPLASLRARLAERVKAVEDLQQRAMVQREAAALLAQRIELLSTRPWSEARDQQAALQADLQHWREQAAALRADAQWPSVDLRYPPQLDAAQTQLEAVWEAFVPALAQAVAASTDAEAPLPPVPLWAEELRAARMPATDAGAEPARPRIDPEQRAAATRAVEAGVMLLEQAVAAGHTKNMNSATQALRQSLKVHGRLIDDALEARVHAALVSAGELGGWQRWSADKAREQLVARAEALLVRRPRKADATGGVAEASAQPSAPASGTPQALEGTVAAPDGQDAASPIGSVAGEADAQGVVDAGGGHSAPAEAPTGDSGEAAYELVPAMGGRKLQEAIRKLREEWKTADQGGPPNHALWKRFDRACNAAHKHVEAWLQKARAESAEHRAQRLALIEEVKAWSAAQDGSDWKAVSRQLHQFSERWRNAGHLGEKMYAELQQQWKAVIQAAAAPLEAEQKASTVRRQALIAEAEALGAEPRLRIDAVRALQQRWQAEAQAVPLDRRHEQKLWDAFRKPIDAAFQRKSAEREQQQAAMSAHDRAVLEAARALEAANASADAQRIRAAMAQLEAVTRGQAAAAATGGSGPEVAAAHAEPAQAAPESGANAEGGGAAPAAEGTPAATPSPAKPLVAVRGDDRPGARRPQAAAGRPGERRDVRPAAGRSGPRGERAGLRGDRREPGRAAGRPPREERGPRLGDAAFRAQREAVDNAQAALRKLAAQAHGEALTQLLAAWQQRQPDQVPGAQELGRAVSASVRAGWQQAIGQGAIDRAQAATAMLRLEMAAEVPTPADELAARRALQLQLLTRRHDPAPLETWSHDAATVLASAYEESVARRLQGALKVLLRKA